MISDEDPSLDEDIRRTDWMVEKIINNDVYAQHLYAALCNNVFIKNESWFILKNAEWSCSWRYAGGVIADVIGSGDYLDWYCSGISSLEMQEKQNSKYVDEGTVTDEIKNDLLKINWMVKSYSDIGD